jgi:peptidoglycan/xylan/chitin deacetylase (PgdA/CDA1 family)
VPPVAITIDTEFPDQPASDPLGALGDVLHTLAAHDTKATFFIVGAWARAHPREVTAIKAAGHHIGNHSYAHCVLPRLSPAQIVEDLTACHDVLAELGIETRPWFRAPKGELGDSPMEVVTSVKAAGYRHIHWHASGADWQPGATGEEVATSILESVKHRWPRPAIVLLHSWPDCAAEALALVLEGLHSDGAEFLTVDRIGWRRAVVGRLREATKREEG